MRNGNFTETAGSSIWSGKYVNGVRDGKWEVRFADGTLSTLPYNMGVVEGSIIVQRPNQKAETVRELVRGGGYELELLYDGINNKLDFFL